MRWQLHPRSGERSGFVTAMSVVGCEVLCGTVAGCSFVLDSKANQCEADADCNDLIKTGHPVCQSGVCQDIGLGPRDCNIAPLTATSKQPDFLNACSTSKNLPF